MHSRFITVIVRWTSCWSPKSPFQCEVFEAGAGLLNLEVDMLFLDTTSAYFETEEESDDGLCQLGYSKDHRPDLPQVVILLITHIANNPHVFRIDGDSRHLREDTGNRVHLLSSKK